MEKNLTPVSHWAGAKLSRCLNSVFFSGLLMISGACVTPDSPVTGFTVSLTRPVQLDAESQIPRDLKEIGFHFSKPVASEVFANSSMNPIHVEWTSEVTSSGTPESSARFTAVNGSWALREDRQTLEFLVRDITFPAHAVVRVTVPSTVTTADGTQTLGSEYIRTFQIGENLAENSFGIVDTFPRPDSHQIGTNLTAVAILFSIAPDVGNVNELDPETLAPLITITRVRDSVRLNAAVEIRLNSAVISLIDPTTHNSLLSPNTAYEVSVSKEIYQYSLGGVRIYNPMKWRFTTGSDPVELAFAPQANYPANRSIDVRRELDATGEIFPKLTVQFPSPVDPRSVYESNSTRSHAYSLVRAGAYSFEVPLQAASLKTMTRFEVIPSKPLSGDISYRSLFISSVSDLYGNVWLPSGPGAGRPAPSYETFGVFKTQNGGRGNLELVTDTSVLHMVANCSSSFDLNFNYDLSYGVNVLINTGSNSPISVSDRDLTAGSSTRPSYLPVGLTIDHSLVPINGRELNIRPLNGGAFLPGHEYTVSIDQRLFSSEAGYLMLPAEVRFRCLH